VANYTVNNIAAVSKHIRNKIEKKINKAQRASVNNMKELEKDIRDNVFSGNQPFENKKLKGLKPKTVDHRKYLAKNNPTDSEYRASKANLTLTGQLVRSFRIKVKVLKNITRITADFGGKRKGYRSNKGKVIKKQLGSNKEVAQKLIDAGYLRMRLTKRVKAQLAANFKRIFKKIK